MNNPLAALTSRFIKERAFLKNVTPKTLVWYRIAFTNYEQPMHTDRNHSWLPSLAEPPWAHVETFLYLCDVSVSNAPTHLVATGDAADRSTTVPLAASPV
jgi:hypothetical protein